MFRFEEIADVEPRSTLIPDHTVRSEGVGLRHDRPFRFCTRHFGVFDRLKWTQPGDDPYYDIVDDDPGLRSIELFIPANKKTAKIPPHNHEFVELVLIRKGEAIHIGPQGEHVVRRGTAIIITQGGIHGYRHLESVSKTNIYLQPDWLTDGLRLLWGEPGLFRFLLAESLFSRNLHEGVLLFELTESEMQACEREHADLNAEAKREHPSLALFHACFLKILWILNTAFMRKEPDDPVPLRKEIWFVAERIESIIRTGSFFCVEDVAKESGLSRNSLTRLFKNVTGMSLMDYYQKRRIHNAARCLHEQDISITDIAIQLGYADSAHFSRLFKRFMGCTPNEHRQAQLT